MKVSFIRKTNACSCFSSTKTGHMAGPHSCPFLLVIMVHHWEMNVQGKGVHLWSSNQVSLTQATETRAAIASYQQHALTQPTEPNADEPTLVTSNLLPSTSTGFFLRDFRKEKIAVLWGAPGQTGIWAWPLQYLQLGAAEKGLAAWTTTGWPRTPGGEQRPLARSPSVSVWTEELKGHPLAPSMYPADGLPPTREAGNEWTEEWISKWGAHRPSEWES